MKKMESNEVKLVDCLVFPRKIQTIIGIPSDGNLVNIEQKFKRTIGILLVKE